MTETARRHHRLCACERPDRLAGLDAALTDGAPRWVEALGFWTQPGVFSWDRVDPGSALLAATLPPLAGRGADLGCGLGYLARAVLASPAVERLHLVDLDRRAVEAARRNVADPRATFAWADVRTGGAGEAALDFVVSNPPFHREDGGEDRALGGAFVAAAAAALRRDGVFWMVANRHLPYEAELARRFSEVRVRAEADGFKVLEARR